MSPEKGDKNKDKLLYVHMNYVTVAKDFDPKIQLTSIQYSFSATLREHASDFQGCCMCPLLDTKFI